MMCPHIRITGDMRVPPRTDADDVAEAMVEMAEAHGWGFTGVTRELTQAELDGQEPSRLTLEMVERAVAQAREMLIDQHNDWTPRQREAGHAALDLFRLCLRQQMGGGQGA